MDKKYISNNRI